MSNTPDGQKKIAEAIRSLEFTVFVFASLFYFGACAGCFK